MPMPKPITISPELAAQYTEPGQFEKFDHMVRKVLSVPHSEIIRREAVYRERSLQNSNRRGLKPKRKPSE
jgi:hypothetical protein